MDSQKQTIAPEGVRRSDRVQISIPIEAIGTDLHRGRVFCQRGQTLAVSRHGAAIILNYALATDQELTIRCLDTNREAEARVVGLMSGPGKDLVYGVAFLNPGANPWGIEFPSGKGSEEGFGRILLECRLCQAYKVFHLNEIEIQVFEANQSIQQFCKACSTTTSWKRIANEGLREPHVPRDLRAQEPASTTRGATNRRKHGRVRTNVPACVRERGCSDEIVTCENLSRGGLRLRTSKAYKKGARIEVAIPYSAGSGNIFVPAQVLHVQDCGTFFRLGVAYAKASGTQQQADVYSGSVAVPDRTNR
jgi:PilZ domain-containing protein